MAQHVTVFPSAERTATTNSRDFTNSNGVGAIVTITATAASVTPSVVFTLQGKDPSSGNYYTILASSAITGAGTTTLRVHPDLTASGNAVAKDMMPAVWRIIATAADADPLTYSVGVSLV